MSDTANEVDTIWVGDHLKRRDEANHLTDYLTKRYKAKKTEKGFVLAVNADWGAGKTFLMDRWRQQLQLQNYPVVYFDAWSNDYTPEPLIAFIAELNKALEERFKSMPAAIRLQQAWARKAKAVIAPTLKTAGYALGKHLLGRGLDEISEDFSMDTDVHEIEEKDKRDFDVKALGEQLNKAVEAALKEHANTKEAISAFKERFNKLIEHLSGESNLELPIFVLIDELDRCRPDYAIKLLEGIKHLFGIPGLYFVIATNIPQLAHSVCAVYGSGFDSERYLKRFFDLEYELEIPSDLGFAAELMSRIVNPSPSSLVTGYAGYMDIMSNLNPADYLAFTFNLYSAAFDLQPRDQEQVARVLEGAFLALDGNQIHIHFLLFLAMLNQKKPQVLATIVRSNNIHDAGLNGIFPSRDAVSLNVKVYSGDGNRSIKKVRVEEIAALYFQALATNARPQDINTDNFPQNLMYDIYDEARNGRLQRYAQVVQRAGRFKK